MSGVWTRAKASSNEAQRERAELPLPLLLGVREERQAWLARVGTELRPTYTNCCQRHWCLSMYFIVREGRQWWPRSCAAVRDSGAIIRIRAVKVHGKGNPRILSNARDTSVNSTLVLMKSESCCPSLFATAHDGASASLNDFFQDK